MSKKILLIGDPHFKNNNAKESKEFTEKTLNFITSNKQKISFVVILGDVLDTHDKINIKPLCRATNFILDISKISNVFVLVGNHDRANNGVFLSEEHSMIGLTETPRVKIVSSVCEYKDYLFVPYVSNGRFHEALKTIGYPKKYKAIFAHQEFKGVKMGSVTSFCEEEWGKNEPPIYSGHIHDFQTPQENLTYIGTPYQLGYGDCSKKGIYFLDEDSMDLERIDLGITKKRLVKLTLDQFKTFTPQRGVSTKVVFEGDSKKIREILKEKPYKEKLSCVEYTIKHVPFKPLPKNSPIRVKSFADIISQVLEKEDDLSKTIVKEIFTVKI